MNDDVIPLNEIGKIETVKVYNQSYVNKQQKRIAELEKEISVLLSCKNCPDNKGGLLCQKEYEDKCLAQKIQYIKELEKENANLKALRKYELNVSKLEIEKLEKENTELKDKLNNLSKVAEVRLANWQKYEKAYNETEELLDKQIEATYNVVEENKEAKEIIKELLFTSNELDENTRSKAEQFLKE